MRHNIKIVLYKLLNKQLITGFSANTLQNIKQSKQQNVKVKYKPVVVFCKIVMT